MHRTLLSIAAALLGAVAMSAYSPEIRDMLHAILTHHCQALSLEPPPPTVFTELVPPADVAEQAVLDLFWKACHAVEAAGGPSLNHSRDPSLIAINLREVQQRCAATGLALPKAAELHQALRLSREPAFVASKVVNSRNGGSRKCWVFRMSPRQSHEPANR